MDLTDCIITGDWVLACLADQACMDEDALDEEDMSDDALGDGEAGIGEGPPFICW